MVAATKVMFRIFGIFICLIAYMPDLQARDCKNGLRPPYLAVYRCETDPVQGATERFTFKWDMEPCSDTGRIIWSGLMSGTMQPDEPLAQAFDGRLIVDRVSGHEEHQIFLRNRFPPLSGFYFSNSVELNSFVIDVKNDLTLITTGDDYFFQRTGKCVQLRGKKWATDLQR
ncbi:hypothetical protein OAV86_04830 [Pseudomonadales bacterium]|nr:hypothetical protein [Pseudomonadales bacterium]